MAVIQKRLTAAGEARFTLRVFVGRDASGKRKFVVRTFTRRKDAVAAASRLESMKAEGGGVSVPSRESFGAYLLRWLDVKAGTVRARTIHDYRGIIARWVTKPPADAPMLGPIPLNRLTPDAFELLYAWMREHGRGPRTIQYVHVVLRMSLSDAVRKKALLSNPTDNATVPTRSSGDDADADETVRAMDQSQADRFLSAARADRYSALWHVLLMAGLRPSEALALAWEHIDLENGRVTVQRTLTRTGVDGWRVVGTKTKRSRRSVTLPPVAIAALREWRATQLRERLQLGAEYRDHGFAFTGHFGEPLDSANLAARNFRRIMQAAELGTLETVMSGGRVKKAVQRFRPAFRVYDLRHTHATLLLAAGVPLKIVSERLGHSTIVLTADTYSHVLPGMQEDAAGQLERMFG